MLSAAIADDVGVLGSRQLRTTAACRAIAIRRSGGSVGGGCLRGGSSASSAADTSVTAATARSNASTVAGEGFWTPLILRTYWRAAASISSGVACGSRPRSVVMFRHMRTRVRPLPTTVDPVPPTNPLSMRVRLFRLVASWVLVAIGVPLIVRAGLGVAPFDVLNTGVSDVADLSFGVVFVIDGCIFFLIGALLGASPGPASWVGGFAIGPMINVTLSLLPDPDAIVARVPMLVSGILILAVGICLVVSTDLGAGPTEVVMLGLIRRHLGSLLQWFEQHSASVAQALHLPA